MRMKPPLLVWLCLMTCGGVVGPSSAGFALSLPWSNEPQSEASPAVPADTQTPSATTSAPEAQAAPGSLEVKIPVVPMKGQIAEDIPPVKVAILLPLSGESTAVGNAMLDAATMAVSDSYLTTPGDKIHARMILIPKDTGQTAADTKANAEQAITQGATFVIGPLFSQSVTAVASVAKEHHVRMLTFSNNSAVAGEDVFVYGFLPEQQVDRIAEYAYLHGLQRVALLAPNDAYGEKIKERLLKNYTQKGGVISPAELYAPSPSNIEAAVFRLSQTYNNLTEERRFQAIFIAEGGSQLKRIVTALKKSKIDMKKIKLLGTGQWDDPETASLPEMEGAWFPAAPPEEYQIFEKRFMATYGYKPIRLASLAYDAVTLITTLTMATPGTGITRDALLSQGGFIGPANSLYRLNPDGTSQRQLAILEISGGAAKVIDPALKHF